MIVALAGHAFIDLAGSSPAPWAIKVEGLALLALFTGRIVLTVTAHLTGTIHGTFRSVPVTFATASDG